MEREIEDRKNIGMSKISISELAEVLVIKNGLEQKEAERFVVTVFDVIQKGLERENIVKVKGLGTFKIIGVEARESVNVNTGERVVIDSHGKITFTPDATMKELVNKPFSQFETVVLNEGIEFEDMKEEKSEIESELSDSEIIGLQDVVRETLHVIPDSSDVQPDTSDVIQNTSEVILAETPIEKKSNEQFEDRIQVGAPVSRKTASEDDILSPNILKMENKSIMEGMDVKELVSGLLEMGTQGKHEIDEVNVALEEEQRVIVDTDIEAGGVDVSDDIENSNGKEKNRPIRAKQWIGFSVLAVILVIGAFGGGYFFAMKTVSDENGIYADVEWKEPKDNVDSIGMFVESDATIAENIPKTEAETKELTAEKETKEDSTSNIITEKKHQKQIMMSTVEMMAQKKLLTPQNMTLWITVCVQVPIVSLGQIMCEL